MKKSWAFTSLLVCSGLAFVAGMEIGKRRNVGTREERMVGEVCCGPVPGAAAKIGKAPVIPPRSGLPCVLVFCSSHPGECSSVEGALRRVWQEFNGGLEIIKLNPDSHPAETARWRVRESVPHRSDHRNTTRDRDPGVRAR